MKDKIKKAFPKLYDWYRFEVEKREDQKALAYYSALPESEYENELVRLYQERVGHTLDLHNPKRFSEKIQWRKLYELTPLMSRLSDKYEVREWVKEKIGEDYLIPLLGSWDAFDDIDFNELPKSFVLKTNNASGTNLIIQDKMKMDKRTAKRKFDYWIKKPFGMLSGLELQYCSIKPKIIAEKNMLSEGMDDLPDYKFFCFDGKVYCSYTMIEYTNDHEKGKLGFFDREYNLLEAHREDFQPIKEQIPRPQNYEKMIEVAEILSKGFSHVRVDLYNINGRVYFGEMTFTTNSGFTKYRPEEFDYELGEQWKLPIEHMGQKTNI